MLIENFYPPKNYLVDEEYAKKILGEIEGIAFDGTYIDPNYIPPSGIDINPTSPCKSTKIEKTIQDCLLLHEFPIHYALHNTIYYRGCAKLKVSFGKLGYLIVRLRHINNLYPKHYYAINFPEKQAELLICFYNDNDLNEFIKNECSYFDGMTFKQRIMSREKNYEYDVNVFTKANSDLSLYLESFEKTLNGKNLDKVIAFIGILQSKIIPDEIKNMESMNYVNKLKS